MRVVLDTNVFISAALRPQGPCGDILRHARSGRFELVTSQALLTELWHVLRRPQFRSRLSVEEARAFVESIPDASEIHDDPTDPPPVARDPKDNYVIALAVEAEVQALVSGDRDLTELEGPPIPVLTPRQFLDRLQA